VHENFRCQVFLWKYNKILDRRSKFLWYAEKAKETASVGSPRAYIEGYNSIPKGYLVNSMSDSEFHSKKCAVARPTTCPPERRVKGGNFRWAFRRVRPVIEQASQEVERNEINNHSGGGYSGVKSVEQTFERSGAPEYPPGGSLTTISLTHTRP
jgi:hypothetical protein